MTATRLPTRGSDEMSASCNMSMRGRYQKEDPSRGRGLGSDVQPASPYAVGLRLLGRLRKRFSLRL